MLIKRTLVYAIVYVCLIWQSAVYADQRLELVDALRDDNVKLASELIQSSTGNISSEQLQKIDEVLQEKSFQQEWIPVFEALIEHYPKRSQLRLSLADSYLNAKDINTSMSILGQAVDDDPGNQHLLQSASVMAYTKHQYPEAREWVDKLLKINPRNVEGLFLKGCILSRMGNSDDSRKLFNRVMELDAYHRLVHYELGLLENRLGNSDAAELHLRTVINQQPFFLEAYNALSVALARRNKQAEVEKVRRIATYLKSWDRPKLRRVWHSFNNPRAIPLQGMYELSLEFIQVGRDDLAQQLLFSQFEKIKSNQTLVMLLAQIYQNRKKYQECLDILDQIENQDQRDSEMFAVLKAWSLFQLDRIDECRNYYDKMSLMHGESKHLQNLKKALYNYSGAKDAPLVSSVPKEAQAVQSRPEVKNTESDSPAVLPDATRHANDDVISSIFKFEDVTRKVGLDSFKHTLGNADKRWILDAMGSGVAVGDYDNDGDDDIYFVNGRPDAKQADPRYRNALYRNDKGRFIDVTDQAGVGDTGYGMCAIFGDVDNDGYVDLFVGNYGANTLYHNNGDGTFRDITDHSNTADDGYAAAAAFADVDRDGDLDLFVGNYVAFDPDKHSDVRGSYLGMAVFAGPLAFPPQPDRLYLNDGNAVFTDVSDNAGMNPTVGRAMGAVFFDLENDGDLDLYITNDSTYNFVLQNRGDGTFEDVSYLSGGAFTETGVEGASMGVIAGDYNNDSFFDLYVTSYERQTDRLFINDGQGHLTDNTGPVGLLGTSYNLVTWGALWCDFDADGWLDIFTSNGHIYPQVRQLSQGQAYEQGVTFYQNQEGNYKDITSVMKFETYKPKPGRGAALLDYDLDGDMDIIINCIDDSPQLLENKTKTGNWLTVSLQGTSADLYGVRVVARKGERTWSRMIDGGSSYLSKSTSSVHFGFGEITEIDSLTIYWHHRDQQIIKSPKLNQILSK